MPVLNEIIMRFGSTAGILVSFLFATIAFLILSRNVVVFEKLIDWKYNFELTMIDPGKNLSTTTDWNPLKPAAVNELLSLILKNFVK